MTTRQQNLFWLSNEGREILSTVADYLSDSDSVQSDEILRCKQDLMKKGIDGELLSAAITICLGRKRVAKSDGEQALLTGLFTAASIEQRSRPEIASHHASRFAGCSKVLELCTGVGFDTAALAKISEHVTSIEADEVLADYARVNLELQNLKNVEVIHGKAEDVLKSLDLAKYDGLWSDPSRREQDGRRIFRADDYKPALNFILELPFSGRKGVKVSPGLRLAEMAASWTKEWIGFGDECLEQVLWQGCGVMNGSVTLVDKQLSWAPHAGAAQAELVHPSQKNVAGWHLVEPHSALVRCGYLSQFYAAHSIMLLDEKIAYGVTPRVLDPSPLYTRFEVIEAFPFDIKILNSRVRDLEWGAATEIKKRGFPEEPEEFRRKLRFEGKAARGTIVLTRVGDCHWVFMCRRVGK